MKSHAAIDTASIGCRVVAAGQSSSIPALDDK